MTDFADDTLLVVEPREYTMLVPRIPDRTRIVEDVEITHIEDSALYTFFRPLTLEHRE